MARFKCYKVDVDAFKKAMGYHEAIGMELVVAALRNMNMERQYTVKKVLGLPADAIIKDYSLHHFFYSNALAIRVEHHSFPEVAECEECELVVVKL